ncbi:MAG: pseudouridine synthase [Candidatus Bathyarchaeota archaeon]|nr:MAG: pseudouridine synthase [Candidatus Bathyarchaeota archaeon]
MIDNPLQRIRSIADYQFGRSTGEVVFPNSVNISVSSRTGRLRYIHLNGKLLATLRPTDGLFSLTLEGARRIMLIKPHRSWVKIQIIAADFIAAGKSVFAKHVADCDMEIRPEEEVVVIDDRLRVLAVGRAVLTGEEMKSFKSGVAVRVRRGASQDLQAQKMKVKKEK